MHGNKDTVIYTPTLCFVMLQDAHSFSRTSKVENEGACLYIYMIYQGIRCVCACVSKYVIYKNFKKTCIRVHVISSISIHMYVLPKQAKLKKKSINMLCYILVYKYIEIDEIYIYIYTNMRIIMNMLISHTFIHCVPWMENIFTHMFICMDPVRLCLYSHLQELYKNVYVYTYISYTPYTRTCWTATRI